MYVWRINLSCFLPSVCNSTTVYRVNRTSEEDVLACDERIHITNKLAVQRTLLWKREKLPLRCAAKDSFLAIDFHLDVAFFCDVSIYSSWSDFALTSIIERTFFVSKFISRRVLTFLVTLVTAWSWTRISFLRSKVYFIADIIRRNLRL